MYNDEIKVANKIISYKVLDEIFQKINEELRELTKRYEQEKQENERYELEYQHWTLKYFEGQFKCTFDFYDDATITVDNYNSFITTFHNRLQEIKHMWVRYSLSYSIVDTQKKESIIQHIYMDIYENKMSIDVSLSSEDKNMDGIYHLIKEKVSEAPQKYSKIIKQKDLIKNKVILAFGVIPSLVICTLSMFIPSIREVNDKILLLYPVSVLILGYIIGNIIMGPNITSLYERLIPDKVYAGYDSNKQRSVYKDDLDKFLDTSEIIIGKNMNNIKYRKEIKRMNQKYSSFIPIEIAILVILSIIIPLISKIL